MRGGGWKTNRLRRWRPGIAPEPMGDPVAEIDVGDQPVGAALEESLPSKRCLELRDRA
jgi:hypothetical protein